MTEGTISIRKAIPIIVLTWIISLITTLAIVYYAPFGQIGDSAITSSKVADGAIITAKLADGSVTSAKILDGTIIAQDIADGSIETVKVEDGAVTTTKIANSAITGAKISDDAIVTAKLADGSITSAKILDGTVTAVDLATGAVTSIKIADGSVTTEKIADYAITSLKLADNAIPHNVTTTMSSESTTSMTLENMPGMSLDITLTRNSTLLIMVSAMAKVRGTILPNAVYWDATVNGTYADPYRGIGWTAITELDNWGSYAFTFIKSNVQPGKYTIQILWRVYSDDETGHIMDRSLTVIALPA